MHRIHTKWRRNYLTIDMFKFTDVTASHVYRITRRNKVQKMPTQFVIYISD